MKTISKQGFGWKQRAAVARADFAMPILTPACQFMPVEPFSADFFWDVRR